ncbi:MAG: DNA polymerase-3 subunit gamma/tau [Alphaproteobacteria bacterium]|jgi:DNA polymerase-3 subunit gamma/tau
MSYQVLARKWRPQTFSELVGQQHVVDAISNALRNDKLHHAYLFTGTRGVGKTTIARIFSKSLNCEQGQSANPCGKCATCVDISDGRYVDLLEIDAASRTKVEDTRELLDNVQYRPTRGKYKVYLIDEVHMLSKHSFNALLKTLEEPPEHVKFLLATTDPQKLPVTVLSRCLQFSLKALTTEQIQGHLAHILGQEQIQYEKSAIAQIARAAQGSIRDSLSLTDQAIAQGNNQVSLAIVANMLGLLNKNHILKLVKHVCERDSVNAIAQLDDICAQSPDYFQVLSQLLGLLHQIALTQVVPEVCKLDSDSAKGIYTLANSLSKEQIQILYQIGVNGKRDLPYAPDARTGLQMTILRMLAFSPVQTIDLDIDTLVTTDDSLPSFESLPEPKPAVFITPEAIPAVQAFSLDATKQNDIAEHNKSNEQEEADGATDRPLATVQVEPAVQPLQTQEPAQKKTIEVVQEQAQAPDLIEPLSDLDSHSQAVSDQPPYNKPAAEASLQSEPLLPASEELDSQTPVNQTTLNDPQGPPSFHEEQPPLPDEEPPMFTDMFGDEVVSPSSNEAVNEPAEHQPSETGVTPEQNTQASANATASTYDLLKVSQQLKEYTKEKEGDSGVKKSEPDFEAAEAVEQPFAYKMGHEFASFTGTFQAFLSNGQKLTRAQQVDSWSAFVDATDIQALTRQLLINSTCQKLSNPLMLTLAKENHNINEEPIIEKIQSTLSELLGEQIDVEIVLGETANTPFQIQTSINDMRMRYALELIGSTDAIQELLKAFDANVVDGSVEAR